MASINGRLVNGKDPVVKARKAMIDARIALQRQQAEESATPLGQTAPWGTHGQGRPNSGNN